MFIEGNHIWIFTMLSKTCVYCTDMPLISSNKGKVSKIICTKPLGMCIILCMVGITIVKKNCRKVEVGSVIDFLYYNCTTMPRKSIHAKLRHIWLSLNMFFVLTSTGNRNPELEKILMQEIKFRCLYKQTVKLIICMPSHALSKHQTKV